MLGRILVKWFNFWMQRRIVFACLLLALVGLLGYLSLSLEVNQNIFNSLPENNKLSNLKEFVDKNAFNNQIVFALESNSDKEPDMESFQEELLLELNPWIKPSEGKGNDEDLLDLVYENLPLLLNENDLKEIDSILSNTSVPDLLTTQLEKLQTPEGLLIGKYLTKDPYGLMYRGLKKFEPMGEISPYELQDDQLVLKKNGAPVFIGLLDEQLSKTKAGDQFLEKLNVFLEEYQSEEQVKVTYFSPSLIMMENSRQVRKDTSLTLSIALGAIILLLLVYYRSVLVPLLFVIPGIVGVIAAFATFAITGTEISGISMGATAVVLGIVLDYSFHFFTHLRHEMDIETTIKEVASPLLLSCLTTVVAFSMLTFANSPILQDFGLLASLSLAFSFLSVILILPILVGRLKLKAVKESSNRSTAISRIPFRWIFFFGGVVFTIYSIGKVDGVGFEGDVQALSYYPDYLKESEWSLGLTRPGLDKKIYILSKHDDASSYSGLEASTNTLDSLYQAGQMRGFYSPGVFSLSSTVLEKRMGNWSSFWQERQDTLINALNIEGQNLGFVDGAFTPFSEFLDVKDKHKNNSLDQLAMLFGDSLRSDDSETILSFLIIPKENIPDLKSSFKNMPGVDVIDMGGKAVDIIEMIRSDFNFILLASSLFVFVILLLVYGRIELTLITFLPMVLSWIWILGVISIADLKFNFVNVMLSTFIFGLGDDFAIFITEGKIQRLKTGKNVLTSFKTGIILSGISTIIGMGVLIFAKHPAINSIAAISVLGIAVILLFSNYVQPALFDFLIGKRTDKGKAPYTLVQLFFSTWAFVSFALVCVFLMFLQIPLRLIPFGQRHLRKFYRVLLQWNCKFIFVGSLQTKKRYYDMQNLDFSKPSVIIINHQSVLDLLMIISLSPNIIILTKSWVYNNFWFGLLVRYAGYINADKGLEDNKETLNQRVKEGCSLVVFPEGTRSRDGKTKRFHKGAFFLSQELELDISPLVFHGFDVTLPAGEFHVRNTYLNVVALPRIKYDDPNFGTGYRERTKKIAQHYREELQKFVDKRENANYHQASVIAGYLFKGPLLEWYVKVKWRLEKKNFESYDEQIKNEGNIYDLGCGYGYLSYYLKLRRPQQNIIAYDFDGEKIEIANSHYLKDEKISFAQADVRELEMENASAIFINDVLHYMPEKDQLNVLEKSADALLPGGKLFIRDGISDMQEKHKMTKTTELFSIKLLGFNKNYDGLHFFNKEFILTFARDKNLECQIAEHSQTTSNVLFVLSRKKN